LETTDAPREQLLFSSNVHAVGAALLMSQRLPDARLITMRGDRDAAPGMSRRDWANSTTSLKQAIFGQLREF
jgi:hypothetical protein